MTNSPSRAEATVAVIACGALAQPISRVAVAHGWPVAVHPLPPLLHNRPRQIAAAVDELAEELAGRYPTLAVAYADCGTYGGLDEVCRRRGLARLRGAHCYDVLAGPQVVAELMEQESGTYLLTDYLAATFHRSVIVELGLDRFPELAQDYFAHYRRVVWLAQEPTDNLRRSAEDAARLIGVPLEIMTTGSGGLERELRELLSFNQAS